jgi:hypothetical protein
MVKGEDGLLNEINNTLYSYAYDIETAPPVIKKEYAQMCMQLHKQLYADKERALENKPNLTVVINEMGRDGQTREIIPRVEQQPLLLHKNKRQELNAILGDCQQDDPESLMFSPIINDLFGREVVDVQEQDSRAEDDESVGTEGEPEKLEETSEGAG